MQVKVGKIDLSVTNNGTIKANVYPEDSDFNNIAESIEIIGDSCIFLATRKKGETIEVETKGKWKNVVIPQAYLEALNSSNYERVKLMFTRMVSGMNRIANGDRTHIDLDTAKVLLTDDLEVFLKLQESTLNTIKETKTEYTKEIVKNLKLPVNEQTLNPYSEINRLTQQSITNITREYRINNDGEELKESKK